MPKQQYGQKEQSDPRAWEIYQELERGDDSNLQEYIRILQRHFPSFCALALKVKPKGGGRTAPFIFNQLQRGLWAIQCRTIKEGRPMFYVVVKFRQAGMSTYWDAWIFWQMWRQTDVQTMVIAHQLQTAETMIETMRVFYDELPDRRDDDNKLLWTLKPELREGNHGATLPRGEVYFADQRCWCMIHQAKNVDPRGQQVTHVLETEFAMYPDPTTLNGALLPQLPPIGSPEHLRCTFVIESTPKGQNEFYDKYHAQTDDNSEVWTAVGKVRFGRLWTSIFFPWFIFDEQYATPIPLDAKGKPRYQFTKEEKQLQRYLTHIRKEQYDGHPVTDAQMYWRRLMIDEYYEGDEDQFNQEYPTDDEECFTISSASIFRPYSKQLHAQVRDMLDYAVEHFKEQYDITAHGPAKVKLSFEGAFGMGRKPQLKFAFHPHGKWIVWETPQPGHVYNIGADPAVGTEGGSHAAAVVICVTCRHQAAEFDEPEMGPENFAVEIAKAGWWYNTCMLTPEVNNVGYVVLKNLITDLFYPNLYRWPKFDEVNSFTKKRGFVTNSTTKYLMISSMKHYVEEEYVKIASPRLLGQMTTFEQKNEDEFGPQRGRLADLVMAYGLAIMGIMQTPILASAMMESVNRVPSSYDLGISAVEPRQLPIPAQIMAHLEKRGGTSYPWNPIADEMDL